jgi:hypothetical protein
VDPNAGGRPGAACAGMRNGDLRSPCATAQRGSAFLRQTRHMEATCACLPNVPGFCQQKRPRRTCGASYRTRVLLSSAPVFAGVQKGSDSLPEDLTPPCGEHARTSPLRRTRKDFAAEDIGPSRVAPPAPGGASTSIPRLADEESDCQQDRRDKIDHYVQTH